MVPFGTAPQQPLLPYERHLIELIGCTEAEYRRFARDVVYRIRARSAAYDHIPDINGLPAAAVTSIIVSLVIGAATTALSFLLAPKPRFDDFNRASPTSRQLGSLQGTDIYTPSFGFDSAQDLANYGDVVPIVFTRQLTQLDATGRMFTSGGVLISPALVWSRIKSWGAYQIADLVLLAGQGRMGYPDLAGLYLGTAPLDAIYDSYFDFYWADGSGPDSRLRGGNKVYGELSSQSEQAATEMFTAATREGVSQPAFCGAFTPTSQTRFGCYTGLPNGTPVRPNWRIISILKAWEVKQRDQASAEMRRYVDPYVFTAHPYGGIRDQVQSGMPGTGVNYSSRLGVVEHIDGATGAVTRHNHTEVIDQFGVKWINLTTEKVVNKGDFIIVLLGANRQAIDPFNVNKYNEDLQDIRSRVDAEMARYDQLLALGATFMIGRTTWQVVDRPRDTYNPEVHSGSGYRIKMKCIEAWSEHYRKIGLISEAVATARNYLPNSDVEESFYPILRYELGTVQNTRRCDATEIGIKSQVWARFNGITNFNSIPTPGGLALANLDDIQLREGTITQYVHRVSVFTVDVRPSDSEALRQSNRNEGWVNLPNTLFCVIGDAPVDIYSFIRVIHPKRDQYEFRLRPFNSAIFGQQSGADLQAFSLAGNKTPLKNWTSTTTYGTFSISARGDYITMRDYFTHRQMAVVPEDPITGESNIEKIQYGYWTNDYSRIDVVPGSIICINQGDGSVYRNGEAIRPNTLSNIMSVFFGEDPYFDNLPVGTRRTKSGWDYARDGARTVSMRVTVEAYEQAYSTTPRNKWWRIVETDVVSFTGSWDNGNSFTKNASNTLGVQFAFSYTITIPQVYVEDVRSVTRLFQKYSGIAEVSHYGDLLSRSCDEGPEHEVVYVNESLSEDVLPQYEKCAMAGLRIRSSNNFQRLDQLRCYIKNGVEVERLSEGGIGSTNLLSDIAWYLLTNQDTGVGGIVSSALVDQDALAVTGRFLKANQLFFDDAISEPINIRSWLASIAPSVLCFTSQKNGRFSIDPALPYDGNHLIDSNGAVHISAMFTDGNMIEDSFELNWLELEQRKLFQAAVTYRGSEPNRFPEQRTVVVRYSDTISSELPLEQFTFNHITGTNHAVMVARYFLALRKHVTHNISFRTLPWGLDLAPGAFIRVSTQGSPYNPINNGIVQADGTVVSVTKMPDDDYSVYYWDRTQDYVSQGTLSIVNGIATTLLGSVFSVINANPASEVYQIEALDVDADGIVGIKASNYPVDANGRSLIARDVMNEGNAFIVDGGDQV